MKTMPHARDIAGKTFQETLEELRSKTNITEMYFRDVWLQKLQVHKNIIAEGWYDPPPFGISIIADDPLSPTRISYDSLRQEEYWPSNRVIDFSNDILFAYASPVSKQDGYMGDFDITLYLGTEQRIYDHFQNSLNAIHALFETLPMISTAQECYTKSLEIFAQFNVENTVASMDLGHCLLQINTSDTHTLSVEQREFLRKNRQFIGPKSDWKLEEFKWFTIEPQLRSVTDVSLPQISFHYVVSAKNGIYVSSDVDEIYKQEMNFEV